MLAHAKSFFLKESWVMYANILLHDSTCGVYTFDVTTSPHYHRYFTEVKF